MYNAVLLTGMGVEILAIEEWQRFDKLARILRESFRISHHTPVTRPTIFTGAEFREVAVRFQRQQDVQRRLIRVWSARCAAKQMDVQAHVPKDRCGSSNDTGVANDALVHSRVDVRTKV